MAQSNDADADHDHGPISRGGIAPQPLFAVVAVLLGAFLGNFDSRLTSVGLPDLRGAFSLGFDEGAWLSTASIGSQIFIAPASGSQFALLPPDNATGNFTKVVQRIPVRIVLDKNQPLLERLLPGMSVVANINTADDRK